MLLKITRVLYGLFLAALTFTMFAHTSVAEVNDDYALKISLENQLERKLKQVIMEITGTDRVVIFVNTELTSARGDSDKLMEKRKGNALVLPGVPEKKEIGSGQSEMLFGAGSSKYKVNKITLSIWIDNSVPGSIIELIQDIAKNVIGYNQNRGDSINVKKVDFESKGFFSSLFALPNLFWLILTLVGGFMLVTVGLFFMDPLKKVVPALKNIDWGLIRGTGDSSTVERTMTYERERSCPDGRAPRAMNPRCCRSKRIQHSPSPLSGSRQCRAGLRSLPRLPSRGPIEARRSPRPSSPTGRLPRLPSRGPIEASPF